MRLYKAIRRRCAKEGRVKNDIISFYHYDIVLDDYDINIIKCNGYIMQNRDYIIDIEYKGSYNLYKDVLSYCLPFIRNEKIDALLD